MMKKFIYPILGIALILFTLHFSHDLFVSLTNKYPCKEGCSGEFKNFLLYFFWITIILTIIVFYKYSINRINLIVLLVLYILFCIIQTATLWYASTYGYGLNLSY